MKNKLWVKVLSLALVGIMALGSAAIAISLLINML